jgi:hypothetical protein
MIEKDQIDLEAAFDICVCDWDDQMKFPGYSISIFSGVGNAFRLVRVRGACRRKTFRL